MFKSIAEILPRTVLLTFIFIFICSVFLKNNAYAAATLSLTASPKNLTISSPTEASVDLKINTGTDSITTFSIEINYDSALIEYTRFNLDGAVSPLPYNAGGNGKVVLSGYSVNAINGTSVKLATIYFKALATNGNAKINVVKGQVYSSASVPKEVFSLNGTTGEVITITAAPTGSFANLNGDCCVNFSDLLELRKRYKTKKDFSVDFFKDNVIDIKDILIFRKEYLAKRVP